MGKLLFFKFLDLLFGLLSLIPAMMAVIGCFVSRFHPTRYPAIHWLGLLLPLLLLLNFVIMLFWIWRKSIWMVIPLAALLLGIPYISSVFHWPVRTPDPPNNKITVATYNIRNDDGMNIHLNGSMFAGFIKDEAIDILCLQEFPGSDDARKGLIDLFVPILPYFQIYSHTPGGMSVALFSRYPILDMHPVIFTDVTDNSSMWVDLDLQGERVRVFNNHLQTTNLNQNKVRFSFDVNQTLSQIKTLKQVIEENGSIRTRQADIIRTLLDESPYPLIVCGDFNTSTASYTYRTIKGKLRDSFRDVGKGYGYSYRYMKRLYRIDFVFYSPGAFRATRYFSPELQFSDHKPVVVTFDFTPGVHSEKGK